MIANQQEMGKRDFGGCQSEPGNASGFDPRSLRILGQHAPRQQKAAEFNRAQILFRNNSRILLKSHRGAVSIQVEHQQVPAKVAEWLPFYMDQAAGLPLIYSDSAQEAILRELGGAVQPDCNALAQRVEPDEIREVVPGYLVSGWSAALSR